MQISNSPSEESPARAKAKARKAKEKESKELKKLMDGAPHRKERLRMIITGQAPSAATLERQLMMSRGLSYVMPVQARPNPRYKKWVCKSRLAGRCRHRHRI
jgi:hypothetical protein